MQSHTFVKDIIGRTLTITCEPCDVANHNILPPGGLIYEDNDIVIYSHLYIPIQGFIVIAPKKHVSGLYELEDEINEKINLYTSKVIEELKKFNVSEEFSVIEYEKDQHARIWILPKLNGIFENNFDFKLLESIGSMKKRDIPISKPYDIMLTTKRLYNIFQKA